METTLKSKISSVFQFQVNQLYMQKAPHQPGDDLGRSSTQHAIPFLFLTYTKVVGTNGILKGWNYLSWLFEKKRF